MRIVKYLLPALLLASLFSSLSFAVTPDRIAGVLNNGQTVTLSSHVHRLALPQYDLGPVDPAFRLGMVTLLTTPTSSQQKALNQLLAQQQDPKSSNYHKWLTPEQVADRFGMSQHDAQQISDWLKKQGFTAIHVARTRNWISFSGTAAQVQSAFGSEIHTYNVNGELHFANATAPRIPAALAGMVSGFRGLNDFKPKPTGIRRARPYYNSPSFGDLVAPGDIATMYDIDALYTAGIDGTGQKIAVAGQTDIYISDIADFRSGFGLPAITGCTSSATTNLLTACNTTNFQYVLVGTDPGQAFLGDLGEADLDVEWSGAIARNAQIIYVNGQTSGGVFDAYYDAIDNQDTLGETVISISYGLCELDDQPFVSTDDTELAIGNSEGITIVNSSGDSGAAQCDYSSTPAARGLSVNYPGSSQYVTSVGGTAIPLANFTSTYWGTTNASDGGTALSYIPEQAWNDDDEIGQFCAANPTNSFCTSNGITNAQTAQAAIGISSTGGGPSNCATISNTGVCTAGFPKPSWQTVTITGQTTRLTPDVSLPASPNFPGYIFCTQLSELNLPGTGSSCASGISNSVENDVSIIGGTSASAPAFAGVVALLNQYLVGAGSGGLGNINPKLYALAETPSNHAFHPVNVADNIAFCTPGTPSNQPVALQCPGTGFFGYSATVTDPTTGYNLATGLGSLDVDKLALAWAASRTSTSTSLTPSATQVYQSGSVTLTASVTPSTATGNVVFDNGSTVLGTVALTAGSAALTTTSLPVGTNNITATYSGNGTLGNSTSTAATVTVSQAFTMAPTVANFQVAQGSAVDATVTLTLASGFTGTVTFTCTEQSTMSESSCIAPPATNASGNVSFHITTTAATTELRRPFNRGTGILYAVLLPGLLGIVFTAGSRKRSLRAMRLLGLIMVMGLSTLWLASCGGSNGGGSTGNPGTPKGTYTITANGASGAATGSTTFTVTVQ